MENKYAVGLLELRNNSRDELHKFKTKVWKNETKTFQRNTWDANFDNHIQNNKIAALYLPMTN